MPRSLFPNLIALVAVGILIALIGTVTVTASQLVTHTVRDQFRSQELQLAGSLVMQAETIFDSLTDDIVSLSLQPDIKSTTTVDRADALALMAGHAAEFPDIIRSVVRFDFKGKPRYAWPETLDEGVDAGESLPWSLPSRLVTRTQDGDMVALDTELVQASHRDYPDEGTFLLIAPVYTRLQATEFLVYELDVEALFRTVLGVVSLDERGQLWVINTVNQVLYQANPAIPIDTLLDKVSLASVFSFSEPTPATYHAGSEERLAVFAPMRIGGHNFAIILARNTDAGVQHVRSDLQRMFGIAAGTIVFVALLATLALGSIERERQRREQETQRRQTARTLLEISRALNSTLNLEDVLRRIMAELMTLVPYDSAAILLLDRSKLMIAAHRGLDVEEHLQTELEIDDTPAAAQVLRTGRPLVIDDTQSDSHWTSYLATSAIRSWMGLPLYMRDKTVGVLNINSHTVGRFSAEEIELAEAFADQASVALQNARLHEVEVRQIEQELAIAHDIQTSLLPSAAPALDQLAIAAYSMPARQVSGDYFQYMPLSNGQLGIAIGDVSGKGMPAALLMAVISTALRDEVARNARPADLLGALNQRLLERMQASHINSALLVGVFDPATRRLEVANGGVVQPYLRSDGVWSSVAVSGYPLGIAQRVSYDARTVTLAPGALLVMLTDGVVEAQNVAGEFYGFERLEALLDGLPADIAPQAVIERILAGVRAHLDSEEPQDDITILVLRSLAAADAAQGEAEPVTAGVAEREG